MLTMAKMQELKGYEPDEVKSLLTWTLRCGHLIPDETTRFYWFDTTKSTVIKSPRLIFESLWNDHATVPNSVIQAINEFYEARQWNRDPYMAIHLMETVSNLRVDRNVARLYELAVRDDAMDIMKQKFNWEDGEQRELENGAVAVDEFRKILERANDTPSEDDARTLAKHALRVHNSSKQGDEQSFQPLWEELMKYASRPEVDETLVQRLRLIERGRACCNQSWCRKELMMVLWGVYSLMDYAQFHCEPGTAVFEQTISKTLKSREIETRLPMESFAVDVTTKRGRDAVNTKDRLAANFVETYHPIDASHGPSPHETKQTMKEFNALIESCEDMHSMVLVPRLFEKSTGKDRGEGEGEGSEDEDEKVIKRLKHDAWRTVMIVAEPEPFDEKLMSNLPGTTNRSTVLDFAKGVSYEGPVKASEALSALAVSRLGTKVADLKSMPRVRILLNKAKDKVFIEKSPIGKQPVDTETNTQLTFQQRSLYPATRLEMTKAVWNQNKEEIIKTFIFRRLVGMPCTPAKCLLCGTSGEILMADLCTSRKDYKRCQATVKSEMADWLFDSSSHRKVIDLVSSALTEDRKCINEIERWLLNLLDRNAFKTATASILGAYTISFQDFERNVVAVRNAYGIVPETDDECYEDDDDDDDSEDEDD